MKFKIGDIIRCNDIPIKVWVTPGQTYRVVGIETAAAVPATRCYRNCGHTMHNAIPERYFVKVRGNHGLCTILAGCFTREIK